MDARNTHKEPRPRLQKCCLCAQCRLSLHRDDETEVYVPGLMINEDLFRVHNPPRTTPPGSAALRQGAPAAIAPGMFVAQDSSQGSFETSVTNVINLASTFKSLSFLNAGCQNAPPFTYDHATSSFDPIVDFFALEDKPNNRLFVQAEGRLRELERYCSDGVGEEDARRRRDLVSDAVDVLRTWKAREWKRNHNESKGIKMVQSDQFFEPYRKRPLAIQLFSLVLLLAQYYQNVPEKTLRLFVIGFRVAVACLAVGYPALSDIATQMPLDPETSARDYHLHAECKIFVNCTKCSALYPFKTDSMPSVCQSTTADPSKPCGVKLLRNVLIRGTSYRLPFLKYAHHSLSAWLARMLSRPDIEKHLEEYKRHRPCTDMKDIWDSPKWWSYADGFMKNDDGSDVLKLLFGFGLDGFNPFHNLTAKQSRQATAIYLVLLNLPPHLRYLPENIYLVGVIPGHPSTHHINHYLDLVVDDFLEAWVGYWFTKTFSHPLGRMARAAIMLIICDMLAARQVTGFPSATAMHFCMTCDIAQTDKRNIDSTSWPTRNWPSLKEAAEQWRDLPSMVERDRAFKAGTQIRWSSFNRLPYWNPVESSPPEAMHFDLLNNIQNFVRNVWGINVNVEGGDGSAPEELGIKRPARSVLDLALETLNQSSSDNLEAFRKETKAIRRDALATICFDNQLPSSGTKAELQEVLFNLRTTDPDVLLRRRLDLDDDLEDVEGLNQPPADSNTPATPSSQHDTQSEAGNTSRASTPTTDDASTPRGSTPMPAASHGKNDTETEDKKSKKVKEKKIKERQIKKRFLRGDCPITSLKSITKEVLQEWAQEYAVVIPSNAGKGEIADLLYKYMNENLTPKATHVLGKDLMDEVRLDQQSSRYPLGLDKPPLNWGTSQHGKLSADQWGVVATVSLVITLVRCWGYNDDLPVSLSAADSAKELTSRQRKLCMLYNFTDLVKASLMAHNRALALYPAFQIKPAGHISMHFAEFLRSLGPSHAYKVPGFERMNFEMQSTKTNRKLGEMEITYLLHHCARASLAGVVNSLPLLASDADEPLRQAAVNIVDYGGEILEEFHKERLRVNLGLRSASENVERLEGLCGKRQRLDDLQKKPVDIAHMLASHRGTLPGIVSLDSFDWPKIIIEGQEFNAHDHQPWGCYAVVEDSAGKIRAAVIRRILQVVTESGSTTVVICQLYPDLDGQLVDRYKELDLGFLVHQNPDAAYFHMGLGSIQSGAVLTPVEILDHKLLVILPHSRMRSPFPMNIYFPELPRYSQPDLKRAGEDEIEKEEEHRDKRPKAR